MENAKHTPGPWRIRSEVGNISYNKDFPNDVVNPSGKLLATCYPANTDALKFEEAKANARLIAAAPDLLEALVRMERHDFEVTGEDVAFALAALAKATAA